MYLNPTEDNLYVTSGSLTPRQLQKFSPRTIPL